MNKVFNLKVEPEKLRNHIIAEIRRITERDNGQVPGQRAFQSETAISIGSWKGRFWSNWSEAVSEAGFSPNQAPSKKEDGDILRELAEAVRHLREFPNQARLSVFLYSKPGAPSLRSIKDRYPQRTDMIGALTEFALCNPSYADILQFIPPSSEVDHNVLLEESGGWIYLLKSGQYFKIGRSETLERRVKQISIALPQTVILEHAIRTDDTTGIEAYWHQRFATRRANGEWFALTAKDVAAFKKRKFM